MTEHEVTSAVRVVSLGADRASRGARLRRLHAAAHVAPRCGRSEGAAARIRDRGIDVADIRRISSPRQVRCTTCVRSMCLHPVDRCDSREIRHYRVRVATTHGTTAWSEPISVEAGLLAPGEWHGSAITLPGDPGDTRSAPAPVLRTEFTLGAQPVRARLYVTSLGIHVLYVNGEPVGDGYTRPRLDDVPRTAACRRLRCDRAPPPGSQRDRSGPGRRVVPRSPGLGSGRGPVPVRHRGRFARTAGGRAGRRDAHRGLHRRNVAGRDGGDPVRGPVRRRGGRPA